MMISSCSVVVTLERIIKEGIGENKMLFQVSRERLDLQGQGKHNSQKMRQDIFHHSILTNTSTHKLVPRFKRTQVVLAFVSKLKKKLPLARLLQDASMAHPSFPHSKGKR